MIRIVSLLLIGLCPLLALASPRYEKPVTSINEAGPAELNHQDFIRICTWNIEWFPAGQRKGSAQQTNWQTAAVANLIHEIRPDILLTQETRNLQALKSLNRNLNPPKFSHLASSWFYEVNPAGEVDEGKSMGDKIQQQCGILSRIPWLEGEGKMWEVDFAPMPNPRPRPRVAGGSIPCRRAYLYDL
jgi:hypothetical protein